MPPRVPTMQCLPTRLPHVLEAFVCYHMLTSTLTILKNTIKYFQVFSSKHSAWETPIFGYVPIFSKTLRQKDLLKHHIFKCLQILLQIGGRNSGITNCPLERPVSNKLWRRKLVFWIPIISTILKWCQRHDYVIETHNHHYLNPR